MLWIFFGLGVAFMLVLLGAEMAGVRSKPLTISWTWTDILALLAIGSLFTAGTLVLIQDWF